MQLSLAVGAIFGISALAFAAVTQMQATQPQAVVSGGQGSLTLICPPRGKGFCGSLCTDPSVSGWPFVQSTCDANPVVTWSDTMYYPTTCPTDRFDRIVIRTWRAVDSCGNVATCTQEIDVVKQLWRLDIKPTSCPNPIELNGGGPNAVVSIALLGTALNDVAQVMPGTLQLWREDCTLGPIGPTSTNFEDVAAPSPQTTACECTTVGPDGYMDLRLAFSKRAIINQLGLANVQPGTMVPLVLTGRLANGCQFRATDCVRVQ